VRTWKRAPALLSLALLASCSSATYNEAYERRLVEFREAAAFSALERHPLRIEDLALSLRPPKGWSQARVNAAVPEWLPQTLKLRRVAEGTIAVGGDLYPASLFAATRDDQPAYVERELEAAARRGQGTNQSTLRWLNPEARSTTAGPSVWRASSFSREDTVSVSGATGTRPIAMQVHCEAWISADIDQKRCVVLVWLVPMPAAGAFELPFEDLAALVARTVDGFRDESPFPPSATEPPATGQPDS
jgi:hypothetical protein